jgi:hypothetical protein
LALRDLPCDRFQIDEAWSFVYAKQKNVPAEMVGTLAAARARSSLETVLRATPVILDVERIEQPSTRAETTAARSERLRTFAILSAILERQG